MQVRRSVALGAAFKGNLGTAEQHAPPARVRLLASACSVYEGGKQGTSRHFSTHTHKPRPRQLAVQAVSCKLQLQCCSKKQE